MVIILLLGPRGMKSPCWVATIFTHDTAPKSLCGRIPLGGGYEVLGGRAKDNKADMPIQEGVGFDHQEIISLVEARSRLTELRKPFDFDQG